MNDLAAKDTTELQEFSAESLLREAVGSGVPVETIERLLVMRKELKEEHAREVFNSAMVGFKSECPPIKKTKEVKNKNGTSRYFYAPLEEIDKQITPTLTKFGFTYSFRARPEADAVTEIAVITHKLGHSIEAPFKIPIEEDAYMNDGQKVASASSMAKRYALKDALGLIEVGDDDDGQTLGDGMSPQDLFKGFVRCTEGILENYESIMGIKDAIQQGDMESAAQLLYEIPIEETEKFWRAYTKGGPFTTDENNIIRSEVTPIIRQMKEDKFKEENTNV